MFRSTLRRSSGSPSPRPALSLGLVALCFTACGLLAAVPGAAEPGSEALEFTDLMKLRMIESPVLADDGRWTAYELRPDRGDGHVELKAVDGSKSLTVERGREPQLSADSAWGAVRVVASLEETEKADDEAPEPVDSLHLVALQGSHKPVVYERVQSFAFSEDGRFLLVHHAKDEDQDEAGDKDEDAAEPVAAEPAGTESKQNPEKAETEAGEKEKETDEADEEEEKDERLGTALTLRQLATGEELRLAGIESAAFSDDSRFLAYSVAAAEGENGLFLLPLAGGLPGTDQAVTVTESQAGRYSHLSWAEDAASLAFIAAIDDKDGEPGPGTLWLWSEKDGARSALASADAPEGFMVPSENGLTWSRDGERLFFGLKPTEPEDETDGDKDETDGSDEEVAFDAYDVDAILEKTELDVWHVDDPSIKTNARQEWDEEKKRTFLAVLHVQDGRIVPLADAELRQVEPTHATHGVLGRADTPYLKERTWDGFYADLYWISLEDGSRKLLAQRVQDDEAVASPDGRRVAWYEDGHWHMWSAADGESRNLTAGLDIPFTDEDHDYPAAVPGYGSPGWLDDGSAVLIYDKYDLWSFPVSGEPVRLTADEGREKDTRFRLWDLDPESEAWSTESPWLLTGYRDALKNDSVWSYDPRGSKLQKVVESERRYRFVAKADDADRILFTRESYREFPDLRVADSGFGSRARVSDANPEIADFAWGHAELVEWTSIDGTPLQGVLIRPETLEEGERCPVLIYYYRFFSQRLHEFNEPKVNHRPSFPVYASHGYCVFLPDVRFEVGRPGLSAVKALVPGVQKLVDMGVADPDALGLHGHSWSGYQTAFVVTQTDIFTAAVAGAPVSNMTSAYGGIRYGSGLARQFQYEKFQSRLGVSLWENRDLYIENSPLFYADRIRTPMLLQFGDVDEAVPWTQGIELYLALRRLGKEAVFLQYRDEPHHLKKYANKLDYSIKMKQYFDHYLKGEPAPEWITEGVPFQGD